MKLREGIYLSYDDVMIEPQITDLHSRSEVTLERKYKFKHSPLEITGVGVVAANMDTTGSFAMAKALAKHKCFTALHKFYTEDELVQFYYENFDLWDYTFYTLGLHEQDFKKLENVSARMYTLIPNFIFPRLICIDAAYAGMSLFFEKLRLLRSLYPKAVIMAGNCATPNVAEQLILNGADIAKNGIAGGGVCTTKNKTGVGVPMLSSVDLVSHAVHGLSGHVCADGGMKQSSDVCKSAAIGADFVMLGSMLSGTDECEGEWVEREGKKFLKFHGMSSKEAQEKWYGEMKNYRAAEGKEILVEYKGSAENIILDILGGLRSCCTYVGARKLKDLPKCAVFVRVK